MRFFQERCDARASARGRSGPPVLSVLVAVTLLLLLWCCCATFGRRLGSVGLLSGNSRPIIYDRLHFTP